MYFKEVAVVDKDVSCWKWLEKEYLIRKIGCVLLYCLKSQVPNVCIVLEMDLFIFFVISYSLCLMYRAGMEIK